MPTDDDDDDGPTDVDSLRTAIVEKLSDEMDPDNAAAMVQRFEDALRALLNPDPE